MEKIKFKKSLSLFLSILMIFTMIPTTIFTFATSETNYPVMEAYNAASSGDYHKYYNKVYSVTFLDSIDEASMNATDTVDKWDVSEAKDGSVMAWMKKNSENSSLYDVYIAGEGGVAANPNSSYIFYCFSALKEVNGLENFKTDNVTSFYHTFEKCSALEKINLSSFNTSNVTNFNYMFCDCTSLIEVNLSNWNTSKATSMGYMFKNCKILPEIDISSFETSNVTNMEHLFYNCHELAVVYVGDGWNIDNVVNGNSVFNCCYALMGGKENYDNGKTDISFATNNNNGFMTPESEKPQPEINKYTVTYIFEGETPENVNVPTSFEADEGTTITVESAPAAEGYIFSGWSSTDADITSGSFKLNNNVIIKGSWTKINYYNVSYEYTGDVPVNAPKYETKTYEEGTTVIIENNPTVEDYIFSGWSTNDADITSGSFDIYNNVVIKGNWIKINYYDVTYKYTGDVPTNAPVINTETYEEGTKVAVADTPFVDGYIFSGWTTNDTDISKGSFTINNNVVITGEWTKILEYTVTYEYVGNIPTNVPVYETKTYRDGTTVTVETVPYVEGYIFSGWTSNDVNISTGSFNIANDVVIVGRWTKINYYNVSYKYTGDVPANAPKYETKTYKENSSVNVVETPRVNGYIFNGWTSTDTDISNGSFTITSDVVITGNWTKINYYDVTYKYTGDVPTTAILPETKTYEEDETVTVATTPYVEGYIFEGWKTTDENISTGSFEIANNVTIIGNWVKINYYDVTYKYEGNIPTDLTAPSKVTYKEGTNVIVETTPAVEGYIFSGWSTKDADISTGSFEIKNDVVITGYWTKINYYDVSYVYEGEVPTNAPTYKTKTYEEGTNVVVETAPVIDGYIFSGWTSTDADISDGTFTITKDTVITGNWTKINYYTVTYKYTGNVPSNAPTIKSQTYAEGTTVNVAKTPNVNDYIFSGWTTNDADITNGSFIITKDTIITGNWNKINYTLKINGNNKMIDGEKQTLKATIIPANPNKTVKWSTENSNIVEINPLTGDVKAVNPGKTLITATIPNTETTETFIINVESPEYKIVANTNAVTLQANSTAKLNINVIPTYKAPTPTYTSEDTSIATVDNNGVITGVSVGTTNITAKLPNDNSTTVTVTVTEEETIVSGIKHFIVFGKTEKIGWYNVSMDGGETFQIVFGNSNLEVAEGTELIIKATKSTSESFSFNVNGKEVIPNENGEIRVIVDGYMLIGAFDVPIDIEDVEESLNWFQRLIKAIKDFFAKLFDKK